MGLFNWGLNRGLDNKTIFKNTDVITVRAHDPIGLNNETAKYIKKGYVISGNPYTETRYGKTTFYQTMVVGAQQTVNANGETVTTAAESRGSFPWGWLILLILLVVAFPWLLLLAVPFIIYGVICYIKGKKVNKEKGTEDGKE